MGWLTRCMKRPSKQRVAHPANDDVTDLPDDLPCRFRILRTGHRACCVPDRQVKTGTQRALKDNRRSWLTCNALMSEAWQASSQADSATSALQRSSTPDD